VVKWFLAFRLGGHNYAVLANLVLLHGVGQALPLLFVLVPRLERHQLLGIIDRRSRRIAELDLAVLVAYYNVLLGRRPAAGLER
jgi:hypothetical protein